MNSRNRGRASRLVVLLFISILASGTGCSPEGTGTVDIKGPDKVRENLDKATRPVAAKGATDDMGAKFRKRGGD
jgi:hypothetical protein